MPRVKELKGQSHELFKLHQNTFSHPSGGTHELFVFFLLIFSQVGILIQSDSLVTHTGGSPDSKGTQGVKTDIHRGVDNQQWGNSSVMHTTGSRLRFAPNVKPLLLALKGKAFRTQSDCSSKFSMTSF